MACSPAGTAYSGATAAQDSSPTAALNVGAVGAAVAAVAVAVAVVVAAAAAAAAAASADSCYQ